MVLSKRQPYLRSAVTVLLAAPLFENVKSYCISMRPGLVASLIPLGPLRALQLTLCVCVCFKQEEATQERKNVSQPNGSCALVVAVT